MYPHREWSTDIRPGAQSHILLGDDSSLFYREEGTIHFTVHSGKRPYTFLLPNTLYAPALRHTLISCSVLSSSGLLTYFSGPSSSLTMLPLHLPRSWSLAVRTAIAFTS
jgi:hypothetical protein